MIIALLTDFGTADYYVGAMKGAIRSICRHCEIIDITHEIPPQDIQAATFVLSSCFNDFPPGTIFTCVVDPGVGSVRRPIVVESSNRLYVAPDNGLLSFIVHSGESFTAREIINADYFKKPVSITFHGRDIFAPVSAHLAAGVPLEEIGPVIEDLLVIPESKVEKGTGGLFLAEVIYIDRFGNLVTNLTSEMLSGNFLLTVGECKLDRLSKTFFEGTEGQAIAYEGSAGFIEIGVKNGNASELMKIEKGMNVEVELINSL